jgi:hypothetical protein
VLDDPATRSVADKDGCLTLWYGEDRRVVMYPADDDTLLNFAGIHPDAEYAAGEGDGEWEGGVPRCAQRMLMAAVR